MGGVPKQGVLSTGLRKHLLELCDYIGTTYTVLACTQLLHLFTFIYIALLCIISQEHILRGNTGGDR